MSSLPDQDADQLLNEAIAQHQAGRLRKAQSLYDTVIALQPDNATAWINLGATRRALGHMKEAVLALKCAVKIVPEQAGAWFNLGNALTGQGEWQEASDAFDKAVQLEPGLIDAYVNWGDALSRAGKHDTALDVFRLGLTISPTHPGLLSNIGNVLLNLHRTAEALPFLENAAEAMPNSAVAVRNLANARRLSGDPILALSLLDPLIKRDPNDANARCIRAFAFFSLGDYANAWHDYTMRWHTEHHEAVRPFEQPPWSGQSLRGKTILVWGEQAVGDEIMFGTMLSELQSMGGNIIIETEYRLVPLFRRAFPQFEVLARTNPPDPNLFSKKIDFQISIGDLGQYLRPKFSSFDKNQPYLLADSGQTEVLNNRYSSLAKGRKRVGISWRSGVEHAGIARSLDCQSLTKLLVREDIWWLSLQFGNTHDDLTELEKGSVSIPYVDRKVDPLKSMDDLAAQIKCLDLVISVANTTVHIAGALGIQTYALLPHIADWRWQNEGEKCNWYPDVTLLRQTRPGEWSSVIERLMGKLNKRGRGSP